MLRVVAVIGAVSLAPGLFAADNPKHNDAKCKMTGTLETGIVAVGGETTGVVIRTSRGDWELDFHGNSELENTAKKLNKKEVTVEGTCRTVTGVEKPVRHIVQVVRLQATEKK